MNALGGREGTVHIEIMKCSTPFGDIDECTLESPERVGARITCVLNAFRRH